MNSRALLGAIGSKVIGKCSGIKRLPIIINQQAFRTASNKKGTYDYETLLVRTPHDHVVSVEMHRPEKLNSMNKEFFREFLACFREIHHDTNCRAVVLSGAGSFFTSGLDYADMQDLTSQITNDDDVARKSKFLQEMVASYQESFNAIEKCHKPVIAAVHGGCIGAGVDLMATCDIRYCTKDAWFSIKEVDLGLAADLGTLQRLPKIVGNDSLVRELVYTARKFYPDEAKEMGFVSRVFDTPESLYESALNMAKLIASKSPVAVQGSKVNLNYSRDRSVQDGLQFMTFWNMTMLQSEDLMKAAGAILMKSKEPPTFSKL